MPVLSFSQFGPKADLGDQGKDPDCRWRQMNPSPGVQVAQIGNPIDASIGYDSSMVYLFQRQ
jgi:hypothetical protein